MKINTIEVYLYFLYLNKNMNNNFFNQIFHFHRFLATEKNIKWERMFWFDSEKDVSKDVEFENILRTMLHHLWIDTSYSITSEGEEYTENHIFSKKDFIPIMDDFLSTYNKETYKEKSCFLEGHSFPVSCHLCKERVCCETKITSQDILNLLNFKGFKNPYKEEMYKNPYFN